MKVKAAASAKSLQSCLILCDPIDAAHQAPLSLGFSKQEHWNGLPFSSPMHVCMLSRFSCVWLYATLWAAAYQASLSTGFSLGKNTGVAFHFLLQKVKEESEKAGLKLNIQKTKIMASGLITSGQIDGKQWKQWETLLLLLFFLAPKSLQMVTAAMKLKDACFL